MPGDDLVFWTSKPDSVFRTIVVRPHECGRMLSYLVHPDTPARVVYDYVVALKDRFHDRNNAILANPARLGHDAFEKIAITAGIVETLFRIAKDGRKEMERVFTSYFALEGLWNLILNGTPPERKVLMEVFINEHDVVEFCLQAPTSKARKYAPRYYSMYQENAVWAILELVLVHPIPEQEHYNKLIKHDPEILDLILSCAKMRRPAWYAQLEVNARMTEALTLMLNFSSEMVPGLGLCGVDDDELRKRLDKKWEGLMEGVNLLVSRPRWLKMVRDVWTHIEEENLDEIHRFLKRAQEDYYAMEPYKDKDFYNVAVHRGACRIATLRLVVTLTFLSDLPNNKITDTDLLNLLPITHSACQIVKKEDDVRGGQGTLKDLAEIVERKHLTFYKCGRTDRTVVLSSKEEEELLEIHDEVLTGPIAHLRLLISLAKRGLFEKVAQHEGEWEGLDVSGGIGALRKKILSDKDIYRCLVLSLKRLSDRREDGNRQFRTQRHLEEARFQYWGAAQLAAALIEFDEVTNGKYTSDAASLKGKASKELVLSLGNAAEMALGQEYWDRALVFAAGAVKVAEDHGMVDTSGRAVKPEEDVIGEAVHEKNKRRVERAKAGIQVKRV
ncbi:hypothetical protein H1R20_g4842, partial [Candolleomyces eurysporus]